MSPRWINIATDLDRLIVDVLIANCQVISSKCNAMTLHLNYFIIGSVLSVTWNALLTRLGVMTNEAIRYSRISISLAQQNEVIFISALKISLAMNLHPRTREPENNNPRDIVQTIRHAREFIKRWKVLWLSAEFQFVFMGHYPIMQRRKEQTVKISLAVRLGNDLRGDSHIQHGP